MAPRRQATERHRGKGPRRRSLLDLFFPDWYRARDRRRKGVMLLFLLAFAAALLSALARHFG